MAVIVNEFGSVGLDHTLMWQSGGVVELVDSGCVCCEVGEDLLGTMEQLFYARLHRKIPKFERLLIETTGLANPGPIVQALRAHPLVNERFRLASVLCALDATQTPDRFLTMPEALTQVAAADVVFLTKGDLASLEMVSAWQQNLQHLNPVAEVVPVRSDAWPRSLADHFERDLLPQRRDQQQGIRARALRPSARKFGGREIQSVTVHLPDPVCIEAVTNAFQALTEQLGERLLRLKGMVHLDGVAGLAVVQAVGTRMSPFEQSPDQEAAGFLVLIFIGTSEDAERATSRLKALIQHPAAAE